MTDRELMQMALDALMTCQEDWIFDGEDERPTKTYDEKLVSAAFKALRARLAQPEQAPTNNGRYLTGYKAQPEQEPWGYISHKSWKMPVFVEADDLQAANLPFNNPAYTPVYKAPPQREWQELTDEEIEKLYLGSFDEGQFARAIETKLKEKNNA